MNLPTLLGALALAFSVAAAPAAPASPAAPAQAPNAAAKSGPATSTAHKAPKLTVEEAIALAAEARSVYWHVENGGKRPEGPLATFELNGTHYFYLGKDIGTPEKYVAYLSKSFTKDTAKAFLKNRLDSKYVVKHNGRLAKVDADKGSLAEWKQAKASLVKETKVEKQFKFYVPIGENYDCETYKLTFRYIQGAGWRIVDDPEAEPVGRCPVPGAKTIDAAAIRTQAKLGLTYDEVNELFGAPEEVVASAKDDSDVWRYDITQRDDYRFRTESDDVDLEGIKKGKIDIQLFIIWSEEGTIAGCTFYYKDKNSKVFEERLLVGGNWQKTVIQ